MISNFSIIKKLRINFGRVVLFFIMFIGLVFMSFNGVKSQFGTVTDDTIPDIIAILELKSLSKRLIAEILGYVASGEEGEIEEITESLLAAAFRTTDKEWRTRFGDTVRDIERISQQLIDGARMVTEFLEKMAKYEDEVLTTIDELVHLQTASDNCLQGF